MLFSKEKETYQIGWRCYSSHSFTSIFAGLGNQSIDTYENLGGGEYEWVSGGYPANKLSPGMWYLIIWLPLCDLPMLRVNVSEGVLKLDSIKYGNDCFLYVDRDFSSTAILETNGVVGASLDLKKSIKVERGFIGKFLLPFNCGYVSASYDGPNETSDETSAIRIQPLNIPVIDTQNTDSFGTICGKPGIWNFKISEHMMVENNPIFLYGCDASLE
jgi:hypothetical protein